MKRAATILLLALPILAWAGWYVGVTQPAATGPALVAFVTTQGTGCGQSGVQSPSFTPAVGDLIVMGCTEGANTVWQTASSTGVTFTSRVSSTNGGGGTTIFTAPANSATSQTVSCTNGSTSYNGAIYVWVFRNASPGQTGEGYNASGQATSVSVAGTTAGSTVVGVGWDFSSFTTWTPGTESTGYTVYDDCRGDTLWAQRLTSPSAGGTVTLTGNLGASAQQWDVVALEVKSP